MSAFIRQDRFAEELGKAMADRLGLSHDQAGQEWSAEHGGSTAVLVKMTVFKVMHVDEFNELRRVAAARAEQSAK